MAGLDPAIHDWLFSQRVKEVVDARVKPGHDGVAEPLSARLWNGLENPHAH
jgi:hypothetical protein